MRGYKSLKQKFRQSLTRLRNRSIILLYHRVASLDSDPQLLAVTEKKFAEHLKILRRQCDLLSLQELVQKATGGKFARNAVALTFDDGYADNLFNAKPLLKQYGMPATVFIATGYMSKGREFWWDELERLILQPGTLPKTLHLRFNGNNYKWKLGEFANYSKDAYLRYRGWNVMETKDPTSRQIIYRELCQLMRPLTDQKRKNLLEHLWRWSDVDPVSRSTHRSLSPDEILQLDQEYLIEIGAHTKTHPALSLFPKDIQRVEIQESKYQLERILGRSLKTFSYPFGSISDYTAETVKIIRELGFECACSNYPGSVTLKVDPFQLPRFVVRNWDGEEFAMHLNHWFRG